MFLLVSLLFALIRGVEFTFELKEKDEQCFFEELKDQESSIIEFQVVTGGQMDIDVTLYSPEETVIFTELRSSYASHDFTANSDGIYRLCFSNKMSTITHKIVYFDWAKAGDIDPLWEDPERPDGPETSLDRSIELIHEGFTKDRDYQTHHRLREASSRRFAENLFTKVHFWGFIQTLMMVMVSIGHVVILRSFFSDKPVKGRSQMKT